MAVPVFCLGHTTQFLSILTCTDNKLVAFHYWGMFLKFLGCTCQWFICVHWSASCKQRLSIFTVSQIKIESGHHLPVCLTWARKWRGWWWRAGRAQRRGREWWSLPLHLIGQPDRSASKAWLRHPLVCLDCRRDAEEREKKEKGQICIRYMYETGHLQYGEALAWHWSKRHHMMAQGQSFTHWPADVSLTIHLLLLTF